MQSENLVGSCESMCPESETRLRINEHLLHFFELKSGQKNKPDKLVKSFSRSAAGIKAPEQSDLRTFSSLQRTVNYLLKDIFLDKRKPFNFVYDFIFDRLRCVRQEIVIQNFDIQKTIKLLEPIILFLAYSRYRLCDEKIDNFDPTICEQHLQECLKKILCCYDDLDLQTTERTISAQENRIFIESLYQIFNLGKTESLERSIHLNKNIRQDPQFTLAYKISVQYFMGNYYKALCLMNKLSHILCAIGSIKIQTIRRNLYLHFSHAYSSKQVNVPVEFLKTILFYNSLDEVLSDCTYYNIETEETSVRFSKNSFDDIKPTIQSKHEQFVEDKLSKMYLPEILLLKRL